MYISVLVYYNLTLYLFVITHLYKFTRLMFQFIYQIIIEEINVCKCVRLKHKNCDIDEVNHISIAKLFQTWETLRRQKEARNFVKGKHRNCESAEMHHEVEGWLFVIFTGHWIIYTDLICNELEEFSLYRPEINQIHESFNLCWESGPVFMVF